MNLNNSSIFNSEASDFRKMLGKIAIFALPFLLAGGFIVFVDPYNFLRTTSAVPDSIKAPIANDFNPAFWKLAKFNRQPTENILLGDSRMAPIDAETVKQVSGVEYANLGYGGASVREAIETFWLVSKKTKLKKVYLGINPEKFNDYEITNRVEFYKNATENPGLYFINRAVWEAAWYQIYQYSTGEKVDVAKVEATKDEFWQIDLDATKKYYDKFAEPKKYREELMKISDYCKANNIELSFIIFPTHTDAQKLLKESSVAAHNQKMREDLSALGKVYDFDWENDLTSNRENFTDPVHINKEIQTVVIKEIWGNNLKYGKILTK